MSMDDDDISNRREPRDSVFLNANIRSIEGEGACVARIRNISSGGIMAEGPMQFDVGDELDVELRNVGVIHGRVVWADHGRFGVVFDRVIDPKLPRTQIGGAAPALERKTDKPIIPPFSKR